MFWLTIKTLVQICQLSDPYTAFRLDADSQCPPPKWAHTNNWTVQDDSMLLLGSYLYGICHWDAMSSDERLGLSIKLSGSVKDGRKFGDKHWPQGVHSSCFGLVVITFVSYHGCTLGNKHCLPVKFYSKFN